MKRVISKIIAAIALIIGISLVGFSGYKLYQLRNNNSAQKEINKTYDNGAIESDSFSYANSSYESYIEKFGLPNVTKVIIYDDGKVEYIVGIADDIKEGNGVKEVRNATEEDKVEYSKILYEQLKKEATNYAKKKED